MRIGEGNQRPKYDPSVKKVVNKGENGKHAKKVGYSQSPDNVNISEGTKLVSNARKAMDDLPIIRVDKVIPIDQAVKDGSYEIKDKEVAEKIVDETLKEELL